MHKAKNRPKRSHHLGQRRQRFSHCKDCNAFSVLIADAVHVCGERVEHHYEKAGKAKGWKKGR